MELDAEQIENLQSALSATVEQRDRLLDVLKLIKAELAIDDPNDRYDSVCDAIDAAMKGQ